MAVQILRGGVEHLPAHDLESIFHVLLYICSSFKGPGLPRTDADYKAFNSFAINTWFDIKTSFSGLADQKCGNLSDPDQFEERFIRKFDPYFLDLGPYMIELRNSIFPHNPFRSEATYQDTLRILRKAYDALPEVDTPPASTPSNASVATLSGASAATLNSTLAAIPSTPTTTPYLSFPLSSNATQRSSLSLESASLSLESLRTPLMVSDADPFSDIHVHTGSRTSRKRSSVNDGSQPRKRKLLPAFNHSTVIGGIAGVLNDVYSDPLGED